MNELQKQRIKSLVEQTYEPQPFPVRVAVGVLIAFGVGLTIGALFINTP